LVQARISKKSNKISNFKIKDVIRDAKNEFKKGKNIKAKDVPQLIKGTD